MRKDTHEEFIVAENEKGERISMFVSGVPDKCKHDDNGEVMYFNNEGQFWKENELPLDEDERIEFMEVNNINGGCVSCSKCGKPFTPDVWSMP